MAGIEYTVEVKPRSQADGGGFVAVVPQLPGCNGYGAPTNIGTRTLVTDGVDYVVPLSALGSDLGRLKFKVLSATSLPASCPTCSTTVQDYMTNVGSPPGVIPTPIIF